MCTGVCQCVDVFPLGRCMCVSICVCSLHQYASEDLYDRYRHMSMCFCVSVCVCVCVCVCVRERVTERESERARERAIKVRVHSAHSLLDLSTYLHSCHALACTRMCV